MKHRYLIFALTFVLGLIVTVIYFNNQPSNMNSPQDNIKQLAQQTLDLPAMQPYWHEDQEGRKPLRILKNEFIQDEPALTKFGQPVVYIPSGGTGVNSKTYLEFTHITIQNNSAAVEIKYPIEGVVLKVDYQFLNGYWVVQSHKLVEQ